MRKLEWEVLEDGSQRSKILGGWLVKTYEDVYVSIPDPSFRPETGYAWQVAMCFVPDIKHEWDGGSVE